MEKEVARIPYNNWRNSQLSIARHYGGIKYNGEHYEFDREEMMKLSKWVNEVFPDLVCYKKVKKEVQVSWENVQELFSKVREELEKKSWWIIS